MAGSATSAGLSDGAERKLRKQKKEQASSSSQVTSHTQIPSGEVVSVDPGQSSASASTAVPLVLPLSPIQLTAEQSSPTASVDESFTTPLPFGKRFSSSHRLLEVRHQVEIPRVDSSPAILPAQPTPYGSAIDSDADSNFFLPPLSFRSSPPASPPVSPRHIVNPFVALLAYDYDMDPTLLPTNAPVHKWDGVSKGAKYEQGRAHMQFNDAMTRARALNVNPAAGIAQYHASQRLDIILSMIPPTTPAYRAVENIQVDFSHYINQTRRNKFPSFQEVLRIATNRVTLEIPAATRANARLNSKVRFLFILLIS